MIYQYVACNEKGDIVKGKLTADNEEMVTDMVAYAGYRLINLKLHTPFLSSEGLTQRFFRVKPSDIVLLYRQLALLLESGINIVTSLELLQSQIGNRILKKALGEIVADLRRGNQLSAALSRHPEIFSTVSCRTLSIGEKTGGLEVMLRQMADHIEKEVAARKSIKSALTYPIIASVVTVVVVGIMVGFVLPAFSTLYDSLGAQLPTITRVVIDSANALRSNGLNIMLALLIIGVAGAIYIKMPSGRYKWDKMMLSLPLLGRVNHLSKLARCCRSISLLFKAGLPLTEIMPLLINGTDNKVVAQALSDVHQDMLRGEGLSAPMAKNSIFLPMMVQMVKVGEQTGTLDATLLSVAESYETEADDSTKSLIGMIQPLMTLIIAGIVGLIALSLVSAMYSVYGQAF